MLGGPPPEGSGWQLLHSDSAATRRACPGCEERSPLEYGADSARVAGDGSENRAAEVLRPRQPWSSPHKPAGAGLKLRRKCMPDDYFYPAGLPTDAD